MRNPPLRRVVLAIAPVLLGLLPLAGCAGGWSGLIGSPGPDRVQVVQAATGSVVDRSVLLADVARCRVVHAGEFHDQIEHHLYQRDLLLAMHGQERGPLLLGMEMFQRPAQRHLDAYVDGAIDELTMLRRTGYFTRWGSDISLYAPLWRACHDNGIRIVALNAPAEVTRKVSREGLASLDPTERGAIATDIDLTVASHRKRVTGLFASGVHPVPQDRLEMLYESQTVWDETMAESAARALERAGPGSRMLIVAGSFHLQQRDGVPDRLARQLPGLDDLVVVLRTHDRSREADPPEARLGDYVVTLPGTGHLPPPRLGVYFETATVHPAGMEIQRLAPGGNAERVGLLPGDVVTSMDGLPCTDLPAVRYVLDLRGVGARVAVGYLRGGEERQVEVEIRAPPPPPSASPPGRE